MMALNYHVPDWLGGEGKGEILQTKDGQYTLETGLQHCLKSGE